MLLLLLTVLVVSQKLVKRRHSYCELLWDSFVFVAAIYKLAVIIGQGCIKIQDALEHTALKWIGLNGLSKRLLPRADWAQ